MREISVPGFNGPLDLLLQLVRRHELDITAISLVTVADEYLGAIEQEPRREPREVGAFVEIGAKLAYLKSRALLPRPPEDSTDPDPLDDDPVATDLVERLEEYRRFQVAFVELEQRQEEERRMFPRLAPIDAESFGPGLGRTTADTLQKLMLDILRRKEEEETRRGSLRRRVARQQISLWDHVKRLRGRLQQQRYFRFRDALESCQTRTEIIVSFLALLELLKTGECEARQEELWGEIEIVAAEPDELREPESAAVH